MTDYCGGCIPDLPVDRDTSRKWVSEAVDRFNHAANECWCPWDWRRSCNSDCWGCLLCCNYVSPRRGLTVEHKCELFAKFAASMGFEITRPGYVRYTCHNLVGDKVKRMEA